MFGKTLLCALAASTVLAQVPSRTTLDSRGLVDISICLDVDVLGLIDLNLAAQLDILGRGTKVPCGPKTCMYKPHTPVPQGLQANGLIDVDICVDIDILGLIDIDVAAHLGLLDRGGRMPRIPCRKPVSCPLPSGRFHKLQKKRQVLGECPVLLTACPITDGFGAQCVDLTNELEHCGACSNVCTNACVAGKCI